MNAALKVPTIFSAIDKFSSVVSGMTKSVSSFANKSEINIARVQRSMRATSDISKNIAIGTGAAGAAIITPLGIAVKAASDYETSIASLSAITGATGTELQKFKSKVEEVADAQKMAYGETAKAFELAGSAMPELLKSADALGKVSTAAIVLSKASGEDLESSIRSVTGVMNQFSLGAEQSERTINVMAAGAKVGAASIAQTAESMVNFGSVAAAANMSLEQTVGAIQVMSKYSLFGAEAGTKLRGSVLKLQQAGVGYASGQFKINDALIEAKSNIDKLSTAKQKDAALQKLFGAENISTGKILLNNISLLGEYTKGVTGTSEAQIQAAIKSETLAKKMEAMKNTLANLSVKIGEVLLPIITKLADKVLPVIKRMSEWIKANPKLTQGLIKGAAAVGILLLTISGISTVVSIVSGFIATTYTLAAAWVTVGGFISSTIIPLFELLGATITVVGETIAAAFIANPIGLIIVAIVALIAVVVIIIKKWNEWGAAISILLGPLGLVISLIQSFRRNWEMVTAAFKTEGILGGLKAIGKVFMDALIMPLQQALGLIAKLTGAKWAVTAVSDLQALRNAIGVNTTTDETGKPIAAAPAINTKKTNQDAIVNRTESIQKKSMTFDFKNVPKGLIVSGDGAGNNMMPALGSTFGM
jgi:TP901 family phage tail tape measure protein